MAQQPKAFSDPDLPGWYSHADGAAGSLIGSSSFHASFTASRSSDPSGRVSVAHAAAVSSSRRRRLSEHGCGCQSFTHAAQQQRPGAREPTQLSSSTVKQELRAWQQHMRQDVVLQRASDQPKGAHKARATPADGSTSAAPTQPVLQQTAVKAACTGGGSGARIHRQLSVLLDSDAGLPAFAILSIGPSVL